MEPVGRRSFGPAWLGFLKAAEPATSRSSGTNEPAPPAWADFHGATFEAVKDGRLIGRLDRAWRRLYDLRRTRPTARLLVLELRSIAADLESGAATKTAARAGAVATAVGSLKDLLPGLPVWVRGPLTALEELADLVAK